MMYEPPCEESMTVTLSPSRAEEVIEKIAKNDLDGISMREYMEVSFLTLMSGEEVHVEEKVMFGGNLFTLHACVSQVKPGQKVSELRKIQ